MLGAMIGALILGVCTVFAIIISQGIVSGTSTGAWPTVLQTITGNVPALIGIVGVLLMLLVVAIVAQKYAGGGGAGGIL